MRWVGLKKPFYGFLAAAVFSVGALACGGNQAEREEAVDTLTQRQRDSLLSTMPVPGSGLVEDALKAADEAVERARQHDTIGS
jgi:hypothetical protein